MLDFVGRLSAALTLATWLGTGLIAGLAFFIRYGVLRGLLATMAALSFGMALLTVPRLVAPNATRLKALNRHLAEGYAFRESLKGGTAIQAPAFELEYNRWLDTTQAFLDESFPDCAALFTQRLPTAYTYAGNPAVARLMSIMDSKLAALADIIKMKAASS